MQTVWRRAFEWTPLHTVALAWAFYLGILVIILAWGPSAVEAWLVASLVALGVTGWAFRWMPAVMILAGMAVLHALTGAVHLDIGLGSLRVDTGMAYYGLGLFFIAVGRSAREVSDRKQEDKERVIELAMAQEREAFKTRFLNMAAHELATPLTPLRLQLATMLRDQDSPGADPRQRRQLELIERNLSRLQRLSVDLLEASRLETGTMRLDIQDADVARIVRDVHESCLPQAKEAHVDLRVDAPAGLPMEVDADRIQQVVWNLIDNAIKFTPGDGRIDVTVEPDADGARVCVKDSGAGLAPAQRDGLFQPFSQFHQHLTGAKVGTGLGLYISHGIAAQHGGSLSAESPGNDQGTTFTLWLPKAKA